MASDYIQRRLALAILPMAVSVTTCYRQKAPALLSIEGTPRVFEDAFDSAADSVRVVLLMSPT